MAASRAIIVYVVVLIILVAMALFLEYYKAPAKASTITSAQTTAAANTSSAVTTASGPNATTSIFYNGSCISTTKTANIYNGNFSTGTWAGWNATGYGFGSGPFNLTYANMHGEHYNGSWSNYNGTFFATTYHGGLSLQTGNLTSNPFKVTEPFINFKIISPQNAELYVTILGSSGSFITTHFDTYAAPGNNNPTSLFMNASIPVSIMLCQNARVRVVAQVVGVYPVNSKYYIAVGDFYQSKVQNQSPNIIVNQTSG